MCQLYTKRATALNSVIKSLFIWQAFRHQLTNLTVCNRQQLVESTAPPPTITTANTNITNSSDRALYRSESKWTTNETAIYRRDFGMPDLEVYACMYINMCVCLGVCVSVRVYACCAVQTTTTALLITKLVMRIGSRYCSSLSLKYIRVTRLQLSMKNNQRELFNSNKNSNSDCWCGSGP